MSQHAKLAPSKAHRWMHCPGSINFVAASNIEEKGSVYAETGTKAHEYAAWLLKGATPPVPVVEREMVGFVSIYTGIVRRAAEGKQLFVEVPIDISMWTGEEGASGTSDAVVLGGTTLEVYDLKYGEGVIVSAERNEQLMVYALGALSLVEGLTGIEVENIKLSIIQPRRDHVSEWSISREDLLAFGEHVKQQADLALTCVAGAHLNPSAEACQWCPAKAVCPALADTVRQAVIGEFTVGDTDQQGMQSFEFQGTPVTFDPPEVGTLPAPAVLDLVETWLGAMRNAIFEKLQNFEAVPGWKLVKGREGNRRWKDEAVVLETLKAMRVPKNTSHESVLKSPTQLEKAQLTNPQWEKLKPLVTRNEAKHMAAPENDPRPAVVAAIPEQFENHDIGDLL